ncbi:MAG: calcium-binding protein [Planctomycetota bacterium]
MLFRLLSPQARKRVTLDHRKNSRRARHLRGETLESRLVMAAAIDLAPEGLLTIEGTAEDNRIFVSQSEEGERLRVSVDGEVQDFPASQISLIAIAAGPGNDAVRVSREVTIPTRMNGGLGNDRLYAGSGPTFVQGGEGNDRIRGGAAVDFLLGGPGRDVISGGASGDYIVGGSGNDRLSGNAGDDWIFGDAVDTVPEDLAEPVEYLRERATVNRGNDSISGGLGNDSVLAGQGNDRVRGGAGNDRLDGGDGHDRIRGERGDDLLIGGQGRDALRGGPGADVIRARDGQVDFIFADDDDELIVDEVDRILGLR